MQWLTIIKIVLQLLPLIIESIKALEEAIPQSGQGASKLAIIRTTIESAYALTNQYSVKFDELWPALQNVIGTVVATMNTTGIFKK